MLVCPWSGTSASCPTKGCDCLSKGRYDETFAGEDGTSDDLRLQTLIAGLKRERERERERERLRSVCTRIFCLGLVSLNIETQCLSQSINLVTTAQNPNLSCASAFVRQSRTFLVYFLSHAHIFKLTKHSILNTIRVWSGSKPYLQMEREGGERATGAGTSR